MIKVGCDNYTIIKFYFPFHKSLWGWQVWVTKCDHWSALLIHEISDQDRISPYNIKQTSDANEEKISTRGLLAGPIPDCQN